MGGEGQISQLSCPTGGRVWVCVLCSFLELPSRDRPWLPTVVTDLHTPLAACASRFPTPPLVLPGITSQRNYLYLTPCLQGAQHQTTWPSYSGAHCPHGTEKSDSWAFSGFEKGVSLRDKILCLAWSEVLSTEDATTHFPCLFFQILGQDIPRLGIN